MFVIVIQHYHNINTIGILFQKSKHNINSEKIKKYFHYLYKYPEYICYFVIK